MKRLFAILFLLAWTSVASGQMQYNGPFRLSGTAQKITTTTTSWTPMLLGSLIRLWNDPGSYSEGNDVGIWLDSSPIHDNMVETGSTNHPIYRASAVNGKPGVDFVNPDHQLSFTMPTLSAATIWVVFSCRDTTNGCVIASTTGFTPLIDVYGNAGVFRALDGTDILCSTSTSSPNGFNVMVLRWTGTQAWCYFNGVVGTAVATTSTFAMDRVGMWQANTTYSMDGVIVELGMANADIGSTDTTNLFGYLTREYGTP